VGLYHCAEMLGRLPQLVQNIAGATEPHAVLDALQKSAGSLNVFSAWPIDSDHDNPDPCFYHDNVSVEFRGEYRTSVRRFGLDPLTRYTMTTPQPFTLTEARRKLQPVGRDRWLFHLFNDYGIRDGFVVPHGRWVVVYWSEHALTLSPEHRMLLDVSGVAATHRISALKAVKKEPVVELSPRELAALLHLSRGLRLAAIAKQMELSEHTVRVYLRRAIKKLKAVTQTQAAVIAVRQRLI